MPPPITTTSNVLPEMLAFSRLAISWLTVSLRVSVGERLAKGVADFSTDSPGELGGGADSSKDCLAEPRPEGGADSCTDTRVESWGESDPSTSI